MSLCPLTSPMPPLPCACSFKYSGLANRGATVDVAAAEGAVVISKSSKKVGTFFGIGL